MQYYSSSADDQKVTVDKRTANVSYQEFRSKGSFDEDASDSEGTLSDEDQDESDEDYEYIEHSGKNASSSLSRNSASVASESSKTGKTQSAAEDSFNVVVSKRKTRRNIVDSDDDDEQENQEPPVTQSARASGKSLPLGNSMNNTTQKTVASRTSNAKDEVIEVGDSPSVIFDSFSVHHSAGDEQVVEKGDAHGLTPRGPLTKRASPFATRLSNASQPQQTPIGSSSQHPVVLSEAEDIEEAYDENEVVYDEDLHEITTGAPLVNSTMVNWDARPTAISVAQENPKPAPILPPAPVSGPSGKSLEAAIARVKEKSETKPQAHTELLNVRALPTNLAREMIQDRVTSTRYDGRLLAAERREIVQFTDDAVERLHAQVNSVPRPEAADVETPQALSVELLAHQRTALRWLLWRESQFPSGGILADEMGLGKTLSMLALAAETRQLERDDEVCRKRRVDNYAKLRKLGGNLVTSDATLIVCPASLIAHWKDEAQTKLCEGNSVYVFRDADRQIDARSLSRYHFVVTNYEQVRSELCTPEMRERPTIADAPVHDSGADDSSDDAGWNSVAEMKKRERQRSKRDSVLMQIIWRRVVLDEAHTIKNHRSLNSMTVCRLRALSRWALSGTPIHNSLKDVYALLRFLRCHPFDDFRVWQRTIETGGRGKQAAAAGQARLNLLIATLMLRRTKDIELTNLPKKQVETVELHLQGLEARLYEQLFAVAKHVFIDYLRERGDQDALTAQRQLRTEARDLVLALKEQAEKLGFSISDIVDINFGDSRACMLTLLIRLRQFCVHPALMKKLLHPEEIDADANDVAGLFGKMNIKGIKHEGDQASADQSERNALLQENENKQLNDREVSGLRTEARNMFDDAYVSSKLRAVLDYVRFVMNKDPDGLQEAGKGDSDALTEQAGPRQTRILPDKVVIVSEWTSMLEVIKTHLEREEIRYLEISGNVDINSRQEIVHRFNRKRSGPRVLLLSLKAGGVGLNLVGANHLCFVDVHWNPALEQQAADRIHRVGQFKNVFIKKFVCAETLEERIVKLQAHKLNIAENVLSGGKGHRNLSIEDMKMLFDMKSEKNEKKNGPK